MAETGQKWQKLKKLHKISIFVLNIFVFHKKYGTVTKYNLMHNYTTVYTSVFPRILHTTFCSAMVFIYELNVKFS